MKRHSASLDMRRRNADHKPQGDFTRAGSATAKGQITGSAGQDRRTGDPPPLVGTLHSAATAPLQVKQSCPVP